MLEFLKRLIGGGEEPEFAHAAVASEDIERVEAELERLDPETAAAARLFNRAGDLHFAGENPDEALKRYGQAVDGYLRSGEYSNAMAVCRKMLRVRPDVVRARCTLAWLCIGKGFYEIAREQIEQYVEAARKREQEGLATQQLRLMGRYADRDEFREFLAGQLEDLGQEDAAAEIRDGQADDSVRAAGWRAVIFATLLTPDELRAAIEKGTEIGLPAAEPDRDSLDQYFIHPE